MRQYTLTRLPSGNIVASSRLYPIVYIYRAPNGRLEMVWRAYAVQLDHPYGACIKFMNLNRTLLGLLRCI